MASEAIGLDDIMATLMTMGFEFQDCQEAITNGKLTVQAAVDWIISGKPGNVVSNQPRLKLNQTRVDSSNPFQERKENQELAQSSSGMEVDDSEAGIISRSHLSEKQQQIKSAFEEKERAEARKRVQEEKRNKRLEKERILKEIQADREKQKLTKQCKVEGTSSAASTTNQNESPAQESAPSSSQGENQNENSLIQVRLPSGRMFRQKFPSEATLNNVWDAVYKEIQGAMRAHEGFIQPFPRREFSRQEMGYSLKNLGLVPSGSLVLKKKDAEQATGPMEVESDDMNERIEPEGGEDTEEEEVAQPRDDWVGRGRGFRPMEDNLDPFDQMVAAVGHNNFGREEPMLDDEEEDEGPVFEGFGMRLVPEGVPQDDGHHLLRTAASMAAEAAAQRFAQAPPPQEIVPEPSKNLVESKHLVLSLQDLCMCGLAKKITDPRTPIFSLSGLSNELLELFLNYLKKEKFLNPKMLLLMPSYLLKLNLDFYPYTTNELLHSARVFVNLHHVSMNSCTLITDAGLVFLKGMKVLKSVSLQNCPQITDCCFSAFRELSSLQSLNLEGSKVTNAGISQFASSGCCTQLTHLNIGRTSVTHAMIPALTKFENLKSLCLKQNRVNSLSGIESLSCLESLDVSDTDIVSDSVLCLTRLSRLRYVCLSGTLQLNGDTALSYLRGMNIMSIGLPCRVSTTDIGMSYLTDFRLSVLDLTNYTNVGDAGMLSIGRIVSLRTLLLSNTRITDEGLLLLAGLKNLTVLSLDKTVVTNVGVAVVENFSSLTELSLSSTGITSDLLKQGTLNSCMLLSKLNLSKTFVGDKGLQCLKLPSLTLLNLDCTRAHEYVEDSLRINCPSVKRISFANLSNVPEDEI